MTELVRFKSYGDEVWVNPAQVVALVGAIDQHGNANSTTEVRLSGAAPVFVDEPVGAVRERLTRRVV